MSITFNMAVFRNSILTFYYVIKEYRFFFYFFFFLRNQITLQAAISDLSEAAVQRHPFSKVFLENTGGRVLLLVKLQTDSSE